MLYFINYTNQKMCRGESHLLIYNTYIGMRTRFRECPLLDDDPCYCCDVCHEGCMDQYYNYLNEDWDE